MNLDPLYPAIIEKLSGTVDPYTFERCVADLLRDAYPSLASVVGGDDAGMDGAIGTANGPFPLISTTGADVLGNFRRNIKKYLGRKTGPKLAVVATTQALTPRRKRNLEAEAARHNVRIVNIHDQPDIADRLYRNPRWRLELLGLSGDPPALSRLPLRGRFAPSDVVIGREEDLSWLQSTPGDLLLVGQPGSGKTYLHQHLASRGECLFAVDNNLGRLADAIREQAPSVIVVDDAHTQTELLRTLLRLRIEVGASFAIHANSWPRVEKETAVILDLSAGQVRHLKLLPRTQILRIIQDMGIYGPDRLLHLLLGQAEGKPGLAVALADACKRRGVEQVWTGEAIADQLLAGRQLIRDEKDRCVLASFALGGDAGMRLAVVSAAMGLPQPDVVSITAKLGAGGVVQDTRNGGLQVRPAALRAVLVRDVFFRGAESIELGGLVESTPSVDETAHVLMAARQRGGQVPQEAVEGLICRSKSRDVWEHFAFVDRVCARAVLERYPERIPLAAPGILALLPEEALPRLLDADVRGDVEQKGAVEHPRRRITDWLADDEMHEGVTVSRRQQLLRCLTRWADKGQNRSTETFGWGLSVLLDASFGGAHVKPGSGHEFVIHRGVFCLNDLRGIADLWPTILCLLQDTPARSRAPVLKEVEEWCFPGRLSLGGGALREEVAEFIRGMGKKMLQDLVMAPFSGRAFRSWARHIADWAKIGIPIEVDSTFDAVYGSRDVGVNWQEEMEERTRLIEGIADTLVRQIPSAVVEDLCTMEREYLEFGRLRNTIFPLHLWGCVAGRVEDPFAWFDTMRDHAVPANYLNCFLAAGFRRDRERAEQVVMDLLGCEEYREIAIGHALILDPPSESLLDAAVPLIHPASSHDKYIYAGAGISVQAMKRLLRHSDKAVRVLAAFGEWIRNQDGQVRDELWSEWREALLEAEDEDPYHLTAVFRAHHELAFDWCSRRIQDEETWSLWRFEESFVAAASFLGREQRRELLLLLARRPKHRYDGECFDALVGQDIDLYRDWLHQVEDDYWRLLPLDRDVGERWERMALMALDAGFTSEDLAKHCTPSSSGVMTGPFSNHYFSKIPAFEALASHPDERLREAGRRGLRWAKESAGRELEREYEEEVYGW